MRQTSQALAASASRGILVRRIHSLRVLPPSPSTSSSQPRRHASATAAAAAAEPAVSAPALSAAESTGETPPTAGQRAADDLPLLPLDPTDPFSSPTAQAYLAAEPPREKQDYYAPTPARHMTVQLETFDPKRPLREAEKPAPVDPTAPPPGLRLHRKVQEEKWRAETLLPMEWVKARLEFDVYRALVGRPGYLKWISQLQEKVWGLMPGLSGAKGSGAEETKKGGKKGKGGEKGKGKAGGGGEGDGKDADAAPETNGRDLLVHTAPGNGKKLAYLVPVVEARLRAIARFASDTVRRAGLVQDKTVYERAVKVYTRGHVGALIVHPTREGATEIANQALKIAHNYAEFEVRLIVGGTSRKTQVRDFMKGRRDIVVGTPGRLRDLLENEDEFAKGVAKANVFVIDEAETMVSMGFRDDLDAIAAHLPPREKRQTMIFTSTLNAPVRQVAKSILDADHHFISANVAQTQKPWDAVAQFHTIVPSAPDQIPHLLRTIAHDQLTNAGKSKVTAYLPTTKLAQLYATLLRELKHALPSGDNTAVYELHASVSPHEREETVKRFREDRSGCAVLLSSDVGSRRSEYGPVSRVIQLGIPSSSDVYASRVGRADMPGVSKRADLILLPWEIGFITWSLGEHAFKPCTTGRMQEEVEKAAAAFDAEPDKFFPESDGAQEALGLTPGEVRPFAAPVTPRVHGIKHAYEDILPNLDEQDIKETFASLLGYYIPKSGDLRVARPVVVQGCKDWAKGACGLEADPYVSPEFLRRLGMDDGRTKHFGAQWTERIRGMPVTPHMMADSFKASRQTPWLGRGLQRLKDRPVEERTWAGGAGALDPNDPVRNPEQFRTQIYGAKGDERLQKKMEEDLARSQGLAHLKEARRELGLPVHDLRSAAPAYSSAEETPLLPRERDQVQPNPWDSVPDAAPPPPPARSAYADRDRASRSAFSFAAPAELVEQRHAQRPATALAEPLGAPKGPRARWTPYNGPLVPQPPREPAHAPPPSGQNGQYGPWGAQNGHAQPQPQPGQFSAPPSMAPRGLGFRNGQEAGGGYQNGNVNGQQQGQWGPRNGHEAPGGYQNGQQAWGAQNGAHGPLAGSGSYNAPPHHAQAQAQAGPGAQQSPSNGRGQQRPGPRDYDEDDY